MNAVRAALEELHKDVDALIDQLAKVMAERNDVIRASGVWQERAERARQHVFHSDDCLWWGDKPCSCGAAEAAADEPPSKETQP